MKNYTRQSDKGHIPLWIALTAIAVICGGFWFGFDLRCLLWER